MLPPNGTSRRFWSRTVNNPAPTHGRGDERAISNFLREHHGLIVTMLSTYRWLNTEDYEEMESDCVLAMARAYHNYIPDHPSGASLLSYCRAAVSNAIASWFRSRQNPQDAFESACESLNAPVLVDGAEVSDLEVGDTLPAAPVDLDRPLMKAAAVAAVSTPARREALEAALDGLTGAEIGRMRGTSEQAGWSLTCAAIEEARAKLS